MMTRAEVMLVLRAQQGEREALNGLLERFQTCLFRYIRGLLGSEASSAEDVPQETLLRIARNLKWLTEAPTFEAWAYRIASNETYRVLGRSERQVTIEQLDDELPATEPGTLRLTGEELDRMIVDLSPPNRAVLLLHYQEDRPLDEIASVLRIPLGTVKSRLAYGLKCLREKTGQ